MEWTTEDEHPEGCECDMCVLRGFWTDGDEWDVNQEDEDQDSEEKSA